MYVPEEYSNFKYVVNYGNNYIVLTNRSQVSASFQNPVDIPIIVQYFVPSTCTYRTTQSFTNDRTFSQIEVGSSFYDRADCPQLISATFCILLVVAYCFNGFTRLFKKGGVLFG